MPSYTDAPTTTEGPTAAALLERDCLLALLPLEHTEKMQTAQGETDALKFHAFDLSGKEPEDLGTGMFFQDVLVKNLAPLVGQYVVGRIAKPGKYYKFVPKDSDERAQADRMMKLVPEVDELMPSATAAAPIVLDTDDEDGDF